MNFNLYNIKEKINFPKSETMLIMEPYQSNSQGFIHGGELMKIMDMAAGMVGRMHTKGFIVTAKIDDVVFHKPVNIGNTISCIGSLIYTGKSSIIVLVNIYIHNMDDFKNPDLAVSGIFTMVHIEEGTPKPVERILPKNKEEQDLYLYGEATYKEIKKKIDKRG